MQGKRLIRTLRLQNLLSFGPDSKEFTLEPLNVLIGPNASGKSNLIEAIGLLAATPTDLTVPIRKGGGISEWLWKGYSEFSTARIESTVEITDRINPLRHRLSISTAGQKLEVVEEAVEEACSKTKGGDVETFYINKNGDAYVTHSIDTIDEHDRNIKAGKHKVHPNRISAQQSCLSQRFSPHFCPEIAALESSFGKIKLYRDWQLGRNAAPRIPQPADLPGDFLLEDASNIGLVLNDLQHRGDFKQLIANRFKKFYDAAGDITTRILGGTVQLFIHERGLSHPIPAARLSDGTLRYLCLLTILCHPSPPPLVCIEEPELGLHPDIIPTIAELLVEASQRTQLVVTTHSDLLVSALSETPEAIVVCERDEQGTQLRRLEGEKLKTWLDKYSLGELWTRGEIGGTRW